MDELTRTTSGDPANGDTAIDVGSIDAGAEDFAAQFDRQFGLALPPATNGDTAEPADSTPVAARPRPARRWPASRIVRVAVTVASVAVTTAVMMRIVHLGITPSTDLIFEDTTPTGGDMGAHVWGPAYLRDHLLPNWQLTGWSMDWFGGFPVYRFYMVVPALAIVAADMAFPYGVAFKLVAMSGLVTLPLCCWAFGRLARFRFPMPELFAFAGVAFAINESYHLYGGNVLSTMAGEFSFSIALSLMILGLGLLARALRTGRSWWWAAIVLALACLSHGIVLIYTAVAAITLVACRVVADAWIAWRGRDPERRTVLVRRLGLGLAIGATTVLLSAFWVGPFLLDHDFMTDMKYQTNVAIGDNWRLFFDQKQPIDILVNTLAVAGLAGCVIRRHVVGTAVGVTAIATTGLFFVTDSSLPGLGLLWNARLLPLLYLTRYLLMMVGVAEVVSWIRNVVRDRRGRETPGVAVNAAAVAIAGVAVLVAAGWVYQELPFGGKIGDQYAWGPFRSNHDAKDARGDGWTSYNATGYEQKSRYPEYYAVVQTMAGLGEDRGCGRALWENDSADENGNKQYGTTMALMLLPYWTGGCIGSVEALFFESSGTTPYNFLAIGAMSENSSNPRRQLRYVDNDAAAGIEYTKALGVRYVMLRTEAAKEQAATRAELEVVGESGPWTIYEVDDHDLVVPLDVQPVVVNHRDGDQRERFVELGTSWFQNQSDWAAMPATAGPADWQRIDVAVDADQEQRSHTSVVEPVDRIDVVELDPVEVSDVAVGQQSIEFDVSEVGVPVLVKVSYFPNWEADGAEGPYRIGPNQMVVIPTDEHVELHFRRSARDNVAYALTGLGIAAVIAGRVRGPWRLRPRLDPESTRSV